MLASTMRMRCRPSSSSGTSTAGGRAVPAPLHSQRAPWRPRPPRARRAVAVAAANDSNNDDNKGGGGLSDDTKKRFDAMLAQLRATGLNQEKARRLLKAWAKAGALEPEALKQLLVRRALTPARLLGTQAAIDLAAAAVGFFAGANIGRAEEFPGQILLQIACYFGAMWYAISGFSGGAALAQVLLAARRYASSADALLAAVQALAGPEGVAAAATEGGGGGVGVGRVAANVALAVNTAKVVAALDAIAGQLRAMDAEGADGDKAVAASSKSTLISLAAFLTVQQAEEKGFVPSDYGLTEKEATDIAAKFAMYDRNENFLLDPEELGAMCRDLGRDLTDAEVREAGRLLATAGGGGGGGGGTGAGDLRGVTFPAFVRWWTGRGPAAGGGGGGKGAGEEAAPAA